MLILKGIDLTLNAHTPLERKILNHLNLTVEEGTFVMVMGNNGAGKSSLLNVIAGSLKAQQGQILIDGQNMTHSSQAQRSRLVSTVLQDPKVGTIETMTLLENMAFAFRRGQKRGLDRFCSKNRLSLFKEKLSFLHMGLEERMDEHVASLSGGQRQALSLAMATLADFKILLLDEITAALDPKSSTHIMALTDKIIREEKKTCLMITHNMAHALRYGDRLLLLKNGHLIQDYNARQKAQLTQQDLLEQFEDD